MFGSTSRPEDCDTDCGGGPVVGRGGVPPEVPFQEPDGLPMPDAPIALVRRFVRVSAAVHESAGRLRGRCTMYVSVFVLHATYEMVFLRTGRAACGVLARVYVSKAVA